MQDRVAVLETGNFNIPLCEAEGNCLTVPLSRAQSGP
jgi:hypothetical protein